MHELTSDTLTAPGGGTEASISYGYNANGDETSKTTTGIDGAASNTYTYDDANRLTSWNNGVTTVSYGYDADGNRTQVGSQTFTYDARDELLSGAGSTYAYTPRGTLASVTTSGGTTNSTFDAFGDLVTQGSQQFAYDALGRVVTGQGATFAYSGVSNNVASDGTFTYSRDPGGGLIGVGVASQSGTAALALTDQHLDVVGEFTATGTSLTGSSTYSPLGTVTADDRHDRQPRLPVRLDRSGHQQRQHGLALVQPGHRPVPQPRLGQQQPDAELGGGQHVRLRRRQPAHRLRPDRHLQLVGRGLRRPAGRQQRGQRDPHRREQRRQRAQRPRQLRQPVVEQPHQQLQQLHGPGVERPHQGWPPRSCTPSAPLSRRFRTA